jgi:SPP1 gp7 family putative phage head morphogenesis protein
MPDSYLDLAIKRQAILERIKSGQVRDFAKEIQKIEKLIRNTLLGLDEELGDLSRRKLESLLSTLQKDQAVIFKAATQTFLNETSNIAALYMGQEIIDLTKTIDMRGTVLKDFTKKDLFSKVIKRPLSTDGDLLEPWIKDFTTKEISRVNKVVRRGWSQGKTNQEMVRELVGTKIAKFKDGTLETRRRNASTVVRTSVQHAAAAARQEVWEANRDVIEKYEFLATLDRATSSQCRSLDGQQFEFGKGPIPPIHPNCRSTTIPILSKEFDFLSKGRTRSAEFGPVSKETSYYDWLKRQSKEDQFYVLGESRGRLFREGGMSAERFRELQFDRNFEPLTLAEMRRLEPQAFERAGL